jgi:uncharacterized membrane protein
MGFYDAFFGSEQTQYTAYAILAAVTAICLTVLFSASDISVGNRILIILFVIISVLPSVLLTLFELTCIVTGGTEPNQWWCSTFGWILAAFIIIYCSFIVILSFMSLFTYNNAVDEENKNDTKNKLPKIESDKYAKQIIDNDENKNHHDVHHQPYAIQNNDHHLIVPQNAPQPSPSQAHVETPALYAPVHETTSPKQQYKEPTVAVQALTPASVISQQTQPVPVGTAISKQYKLPASDISSVGTYSAHSLDNHDDYNDKYASYDNKDSFCVVGTGNCHNK